MNEIIARYQGYATRCYDAIKPSAMDPNGNEPEIAKSFYILNGPDVLECDLDDPLSDFTLDAIDQLHVDMIADVVHKIRISLRIVKML